MELSTKSLRQRGHRQSTAVIAHRGFSAAYPENTHEAFERAVDAGADLVETDIRLSADGVFVCHHDPTTGGEEIVSLSADELAARGIVPLDEVFDRFMGRSRLLLDLKIDTPAFASSVAKSILERSLGEQVVVGVRSVAQVRPVRNLSEDVVILGLLPNYDAFPVFYREGGDIARLWEEHLSEQRLEDARCGDHAVWVTTRRGKGIEPPGMVDDERLRRLLGLEVDGVLVNDPVLAMKVRQAALPASPS